MTDSASVRVLTADDHPEFRTTARELIEATPGFVAVGVACCGEQAVELAIDLEPDLVLMDVNMEGIGGIEAARRILKMRPRTVVALISVYPADALPPGAHTCGAQAVVRKDRLRPCVLRDLWETAVASRPGTAALP
jgi:two-component system invasion response regulator UvrY